MLLLLACLHPTPDPVVPAKDSEALPSDSEPQSPADTGPEVLPLGDVSKEKLPELPPFVEPRRGTYQQAFQLLLTAPVEGAEIYYSLDGRNPAFGTLYTGPLQIEHTTILRAAAYVNHRQIVPTETHTYFFPADVPTQRAPADWPTEWWTDEEGGPYAADYEMDPEVLASADWQNANPPIFYDLPVLSIVMDPTDLFGENTGIHENPESRGLAWERAASVELLGEEMAVDCGIRTEGGSGRIPENSPKKSFRLLFKDQYGPSKLHYPFFSDSVLTEYNTLVVKAGYNRTWVNWQASGRVRGDYVRERYANELYRAMGHLAPHLRYVHLLLDGLYWGLYQVEERPDAAFMADYQGGEREEWDVLSAGELKDGTSDAWLSFLGLFSADLSDTAAYEKVAEKLDLPSFVDYFLLETSLGNLDWPDRNWWAVRQRVDGAKWQFVIWDSEMMMAYVDQNYLDVTWPDSPGSFFQALRANPEFRVLVGDRVQKQFFNGGPMAASSQVALWQTVAKGVVPGIVGESARWGDYWRDVRGATDAELYTYSDHWIPEYERVEQEYLPYRNDYVLQFLKDGGLYPTQAPPTMSPFGGEVAVGTAVSLSVATGTLYFTVDGTDPRMPGGAVSASAQQDANQLKITQNTTIKARSWSAGAWSALVEADFRLP